MFAILAIFAPVISFIFRTVVVKFVIFAAMFAIITFLVPIAVKYLTRFTTVSDLTSIFSSLTPETWFFLDFFALDWGFPWMISALISRFLIRRLPFIG